MHQFGTRSTLSRLKLSSLLLLLWPLSLASIPPLLGWGFLFNDPRGFRWGLIAMGVFALISFLHIFTGYTLRCPLCRGHLMRRLTSTINPKAQRTMGSLRMRVATGALFRGHFRCPSCGEHCDTTRSRR